MSKSRKIFVWGAFATGLLLVVAVASVLVLSHLFNTGVIGRDFKNRLETRYHVRADRIRITFSPFPLVAVRSVRAAIPGRLDASVETALIHLKILPLFAGKLAPSRIELLNPVVCLTLPGPPTAIAPSRSFQDIINAAALQAGLADRIEDAIVLVRNGTIHIFGPGGLSLFFTHIGFNSAVHNGNLQFQLSTGQCCFWQNLDLKGSLNTGDLKGSCVLNVTGAYPSKLACFLNPAAAGHIDGSVGRISAALSFTGSGIRTDFTASVPSFVFGVGTRNMTIQDGVVAGQLLTDAKGVELYISHLRFRQPRVSLTATLGAKYSDGSYFLTIDGHNTDIATLHKILFAVNRKTKGVRHFFDILREGQLPEIHFSALANDPTGLLKLKNTTMTCSVEKGVVMAPKVELLVSNVSGDILIKDSVLSATRISGQTSGSSTRGGELTVGLPHENKLFHLDLPLQANLSELPAILDRVIKNKAFKRELAQIRDIKGKTQGRLVIGDKLGALAVKVQAEPFSLSCRYGRLPGQVSVEGAAFTMDGDKIGLNEVHALMPDSNLWVSGDVSFGPRASLDLQLRGRLGPEGNKIAATLAKLPAWIKPVPHLDLLSSTLTWENGGKTTLKGKIRLSGGQMIDADIVKTPGELSIRRLALKDATSDARLSLSTLQGGFKIGFSGTLSNKTVGDLSSTSWPFEGPVSGRLQAVFYPGSPDKSTAEGEITLSGFHLPDILPASISMEKATIVASGDKFDIKSAIADWKGGKINLTGNISLTNSAYILDMNATTDSLALDRILKSDWTRKEGQKPGAWDKPLRGVLRVNSSRLSYGSLNWAPVEADMLLKPGGVDIDLTRATICGISTPGKIEVTPAGANISLDLSATGKHLQSSLICLINKEQLISGNYRLSGHIQGTVPRIAGEKPIDPATFVRSLQGKVEFEAKDGRILRFDAFTKIISLLSISEIYRGVLPDLIDKGCPYKTLQVHATMKNGALHLSDSILDGPSIKMVFTGQIDLTGRKLNVIALVAPQRTVERVVNATPIIGKVLGDAFVTVPVRISGNIGAPSVVLLSPRAIGHELVGVMQRLVKFPFTVFQPLIRNGKN